MINAVYRYRFSNAIKNVSLRGSLRPGIDIKLNEKISNFVLKQISHGSTFNCDVYKFAHESGLRYYHLDSPDVLNTFGLVINHQSVDNKGAACVLQKMIQCGDKKYKVKDAVDAMKDRSFNQTIGTEITQDYYLFPFQTKSEKDFSNLLDVYLNMVYNPKLEISDFLEARGRFVLQNNVERGYLSIQGGMYAESALTQLLLEAQINQILRKYFLNKNFSAIGKSNGMVELQHKDCLDYYNNNFTLNNTVLFTHGDMSPLKHIQRINQFFSESHYSTKNDSKHTDSLKQHSLPQTVKLSHCESQNNSFILSYKLPSEISQEDLIYLNILSCILFDFPQSIFSKYLTVETPYPKLYGFRDFCFNFGYCLTDKITQSSIVDHQKSILDDLHQIVQQKFNDGFIEAVLNNLQSSYYTHDGLTIFQHISNQISSNKNFDQKLNIHKVFKKLQRDFRRKDIFQTLISKYFLNSNEYLRIVCQYQKDLSDKIKVRNEFKCIEKKKSMTKQELDNIINYQPTQQIQDISKLPKINSTDYEIFQQTEKRTKSIRGVNVTFVEGGRLAEISIKIDITDIEEQDINMLELYRKILPRLGNSKNYDQFINKYIPEVGMEFYTNKQEEGLKLYLMLKVQFLNNNLQYAFNVLNNCLNHPDFNNLERISQIIMAESSQIYSSVSQQSLLFGSSYVCSEFNPFLKLEDKLFHARSFASVAADLMKIANPKQILQYVSNKMKNMHDKLKHGNRLSVFVKAENDLEDQITRYLEMTIGIRKQQSIDKIDIQGFMPSKIRTYFPNFKESMVFQAFKTPYLKEDSPAITLLGALIHSNIQKHKLLGGCYTYKGSLVSYLKGGLKQFLQLEKFYQDIHEIQSGKRRLFQRFNPYTPFQQFKYGFGKDYIKHYKQAILVTELSDIKHVLHKYIFDPLKQEQNSQVMMGPHLADYTPLMKTGWTIQRVLEDMSLSMQSNYSQQISNIRRAKDIDIV